MSLKKDKLYFIIEESVTPLGQYIARRRQLLWSHLKKFLALHLCRLWDNFIISFCLEVCTWIWSNSNITKGIYIKLRINIILGAFKTLYSNNKLWDQLYKTYGPIVRIDTMFVPKIIIIFDADLAEEVRKFKKLTLNIHNTQ